MQHMHRQAHRLIWLVLSIAIVGGFLAGLAFRQERPVEETRFD